MASEFRKHTISSAQKIYLGPLRKDSPQRSNSPNHYPNIHHHSAKKQFTKLYPSLIRQFQRPEQRVNTQGSHKCSAKQLFEKYQQPKLTPIRPQISEKDLIKFQKLSTIRQEFEEEKRHKLQSFLSNSVHMLSLWQSQDLSQRKKFMKRLKKAENSTRKVLSPKQRQSTKKLPKQMSLYPTSSILAASKPQPLQDADITASPSKKHLKKQLPDVYKHHLQDLITSMEESKRRLRKEKNKIIRAIREKKQDQTRRQREEIYRYLQQQIRQEHLVPHDRQQGPNFEFEGREITFTNFKNPLKKVSMEGAQSALGKSEGNKSRIKTESNINPEQISQKIKNKGETEQTLGTKKSQANAIEKLNLRTSQEGATNRNEYNQGQ